jgi:hypothetical protein
LDGLDVHFGIAKPSLRPPVVVNREPVHGEKVEACARSSRGRLSGWRPDRRLAREELAEELQLAGSAARAEAALSPPPLASVSVETHPSPQQMT